jgi:hypothetical protein
MFWSLDQMKQIAEQLSTVGMYVSFLVQGILMTDKQKTSQKMGSLRRLVSYSAVRASPKLEQFKH